MSERPGFPEIPADVRNAEVPSAVDRMRRERPHFHCLGMGCGATVAVLLALVVVLYFLLRS